MIRILKGNHRGLYFYVLAEVFHDGRDKLCMYSSHDCNQCKYADVCSDLMTAEDYCTRLAKKLKL